MIEGWIGHSSNNIAPIPTYKARFIAMQIWYCKNFLIFSYIFLPNLIASRMSWKSFSITKSLISLLTSVPLSLNVSPTWLSYIAKLSPMLSPEKHDILSNFLSCYWRINLASGLQRAIILSFPKKFLWSWKLLCSLLFISIKSISFKLIYSSL